jgi:prepilin-type N-terminal cleavage/methylation domain-containing protein/prepilin-type processing-associated H-X9-DG protein
MKIRPSPLGFTLIELLVALAIIAILASIFLGTLGRAKALAGKIQCLSRQRQWAVAFISYPDDHDGYIPREGYEHFGNVTWDNWSQVRGKDITPGGVTDSSDVWYNALPGDYLPGVQRASFYAHPSKRVQFYKKNTFFHCPSARIPGIALRPNYPIALFSIAMNSQLIQFPHGPTVKWSLISDGSRASRTPLFLDGLLEGEKKVHPEQRDDFLGQPSAYANRFSARHSGGGNLVFADGHAQWYPGPKVVQTDDANPLVGGPIIPPQDIVWDVFP